MLIRRLPAARLEAVQVVNYLEEIKPEVETTTIGFSGDGAKEEEGI